MTKDVFDCIRECHSTRQFKTDPVPDATLTRILEAGCHAPSAGNLQPWYFFAVTCPAVKKQLAQASFDQPQIAEAPALIVVLADPARSNDRYAERGAQLYCIQDTAAAVQNMLLAATALGLGSCWVGSFDERKVQTIVEAPPRLRAVAIVCLGYSNEANPPAKERLRVADVSKIIR